MERKHIDAMQGLLATYCTQNRLQSLVIGLSGGIDSAVCAALARPVCDELGIALIGRSIPIETNKEDEIERARLCGEAYCTDFKELALTPLYLQLRDIYWSSVFQDACEHTRIEQQRLKVANGNLKARIRMTILYQIAYVKQGMVVSTDNLTEYYLGFWTLHGDVGDYGILQNLWKTEVYDLAQRLYEYFDGYPQRQEALRQCIDAVPTDGLGITSSDLEQIGAQSYAEVDSILKRWITQKTDALTAHPAVQRNTATEFKRRVPVNIERNQIGLV